MNKCHVRSCEWESVFVCVCVCGSKCAYVSVYGEPPYVCLTLVRSAFECSLKKNCKRKDVIQTWKLEGNEKFFCCCVPSCYMWALFVITVWMHAYIIPVKWQNISLSQIVHRNICTPTNYSVFNCNFLLSFHFHFSAKTLGTEHWKICHQFRNEFIEFEFN